MPALRAVVLLLVFGVVCGMIAPVRAQDSNPKNPATSVSGGSGNTSPTSAASTEADRKASGSPGDTANGQKSAGSAGAVSPQGDSGSKAAAKSSGTAQAADHSKEPVVYEKIRTVIRYEDDGTGSKEVWARVRVQSYTGVQQVGQLVFDYAASNETFQVKSAKVIKPDGKVITAGAQDVVDLNAPVVQAAPMYTDARQKHLTVPGLEAGDVLEYDVIERIVTPFTAGQFWNGWDFATAVVCLDEELTLDVPGDRILKIKNPEGMAPKVGEAGGRKHYVWTTKNDKPAETKAHFNPGRFDATAILKGVTMIPPRRMLFSTFQSWDDMGRWYGSLAEDRVRATPELEETAKAVTSGAATQLAKAQAIYDYVSHIRYVSLSFGLGCYQPHTAAEVMANRYGDCKDKATLIDALMDAAGIQATTALIATQTPIDPDIPTPQQFDHAINVIRVDGKEIWLDSTTGIGPSGYLWPSLRGAEALVIGYPKQSKLERTAEKDTNPKVYKMDVEALDPAGSKNKLAFEVQGGDWEVLFRLALSRVTPAQFMESMNQGIGTAGAGKMKFTEVNSSDPFDLTKPVRVEAFNSKEDGGAADAKKAAKDGTNMGDVSERVRMILPEPPEDEKQPIELGGPKDYYLRLKGPLEGEAHWAALKPANVVTDFGGLHARVSKRQRLYDHRTAPFAEDVRGSRCATGGLCCFSKVGGG